MKILISPFCKKMRNGEENPKNFPYWKELIKLLEKDGYEIIQIGIDGEEALVKDFRKNLSFKQIKELLFKCDLFISVDTFLPHLANHYGIRGIVIFSQSDPNIFGYTENVNLLKDKRYLREKQFWWWEQAKFDKRAFVSAKQVHRAVSNFGYKLIE